jgi:hypothetical protein
MRVSYFQNGGVMWSPALGAVATAQPTAAAAFSPVQGTLYGTSGAPSYLDIRQGTKLGDCWYLASLAAAAAHAPSDITSLFTYVGSTVENGANVGLYVVRYFTSSGAAQFVTVDTELPTGNLYDQPQNSVLWVALAEKAYAEANGAGYVTSSHVGTDSYDALNSGWGEWALQAITGKSAGPHSSVNPSNIASAWNQGKLIVIGTNTPKDSTIVPDHAYAVVGYDASRSMPFEIYNPWGTTTTNLVKNMAPAPFNGHQVYGLFWTDAGFLSQNFSDQSVGAGTSAGTNDHVNVAPTGADLVFALEAEHLRERLLLSHRR